MNSILRPLRRKPAASFQRSPPQALRRGAPITAPSFYRGKNGTADVSLLPLDSIWFTEPIERPMLGSRSAKLRWKRRFPLWRDLVFECQVQVRRGASAKSTAPGVGADQPDAAFCVVSPS